MSQITQPGDVTPAPIKKLPTETLMEIFKTYAESYPEVLNQRVVDLLLVGKDWNMVANRTPQLWTKINLSFPFAFFHLVAAHKRVRASRLQKIDVSIDFRDPDWDSRTEDHYDRDGDIYIPGGHRWVRDIMAVLEGTEGRWRSVEVVSDAWVPLYELMHGWRTFTHLSSLESISMKREYWTFGARNADFLPRRLALPTPLFDRNASLPKIRELSLTGVHVAWNDASGCFQNLRKLQIVNQAHDVGPTFEQFAAMLSSSPRLEHLNVMEFCPQYHTVPNPAVGGTPEIPVVNLPALRVLIFGWKDVDLSCAFLRMFQIGDSLEYLTLVDTKSGYGDSIDPQTGGRGWAQESREIFEVLFELGSAVPRDKDDLPSAPFISVRGLKRLSIIWAKVARHSLFPFLVTLTALERITLEDVDENVVEDVADRWFRSPGVYRPLDHEFLWTRRGGSPDRAEALTSHLLWNKFNAKLADRRTGKSG